MGNVSLRLWLLVLTVVVVLGGAWPCESAAQTSFQTSGQPSFAPAKKPVARSRIASQERERASDDGRRENRKQKSEFNSKHELLDDFLAKQ